MVRLVLLGTILTAAAQAWAQDGPVLAPPTDLGEAAATAPAVEAKPPTTDRQRSQQLRSLLRPRGPAPRVAAPPVAVVPTVLPDPIEDDSLPPELQIAPALGEPTSAPVLQPPAGPAPSPNRPRRPGVLNLEVMPDETAVLGEGVEPLPESAIKPPGRASNRRRPAIDEEELDEDRALARRIEKDLRARLGRQLRSVDVEVDDDQVRIRADANFFWNRRMVRRAIESLPQLAGYEPDIEVY